MLADFLQAQRDGMSRGPVLQDISRLDVMKNCYSERVAMHWHRLPRQWWGPFQNRGDVALRDVVSGHGGDGFMVGLDDLSDLFLP